MSSRGWSALKIGFRGTWMMEILPMVLTTRSVVWMLQRCLTKCWFSWILVVFARGLPARCSTRAVFVMAARGRRAVAISYVNMWRMILSHSGNSLLLWGLLSGVWGVSEWEWSVVSCHRLVSRYIVSRGIWAIDREGTGIGSLIHFSIRMIPSDLLFDYGTEARPGSSWGEEGML